ncbi:MAG: hypothetical protein LBQ60_15685 [Bacteroidales bacterium]|jgi:hypothetical protein|nr:hypothetical protein [Bacteroidales bacterium]
MKTNRNIDLQEVKTFIAEVELTKEYDRKRISEYHDRIFGKDKRPRLDDPCPIMQMRKIKAWYQDQKEK